MNPALAKQDVLVLTHNPCAPIGRLCQTYRLTSKPWNELLKDRAHQEEVSRKLATDERSIMLYKKMLTVLDRKRQVYGEFEQVD